MKLHLLHDWSKWDWVKTKKDEHLQVKSFATNKEIPKATYCVMQKECKTCGLTKLKRIRI